MLIKSISLFILTAIAEIIGCYLPFLWMREGKSIWLLVPAFFSLCIFVWLLTFHGSIAGRTYAAYGGVYVVVAMFWMWFIESQKPSLYDLTGVAFILIGSAIIILSPYEIN